MPPLVLLGLLVALVGLWGWSVLRGGARELVQVRERQRALRERGVTMHSRENPDLIPGNGAGSGA